MCIFSQHVHLNLWSGICGLCTYVLNYKTQSDGRGGRVGALRSGNDVNSNKHLLHLLPKKLEYFFWGHPVYNNNIIILINIINADKGEFLLLFLPPNDNRLPLPPNVKRTE